MKNRRAVIVSFIIILIIVSVAITYISISMEHAINHSIGCKYSYKGATCHYLSGTFAYYITYEPTATFTPIVTTTGTATAISTATP
jgi:hypothetical protein